jgi:tetratricopeptide (TPR) repeat protein
MPNSAARASIVIVAHDQIEYTRMCIESLSRCTRFPYKLVLVDNGSTDGTEQYFRSLDGAVVIREEDNVGFPRGANAGIKAADGDYVVLLNNDTVVTVGWLTKLVEAADSDEKVGIVGPVTNHAKGAQLLEKKDLRDLEELEQYAQDVARRNAGQWHATNGLAGFCMLIKSEVIRRIGYLDERFGIGNFEDDDYCVRAQQDGFKLMIATDCFIYHFGERTFLALGVKGERWLNLLRDNESLFREKWRVPDEEEQKRRAAALDLVQQGQGLLEQSEHVEALRKFVEALKEDPLSEAAHAASGVALWKLGQREKAYQSFERALRINPNCEEAALNLTQVAAEIGKEDDAATFMAEIGGDRD